MEDLALTAPVRDRVGGKGVTNSSDSGLGVGTPFLFRLAGTRIPTSLLSELAVNATKPLQIVG